jgi:hypothetical protein
MTTFFTASPEIAEISARVQSKWRWNLKQIELKKIGVIGFESEDHLSEWLNWECDDLQLEKRIKKVLQNF